MTTLRAIPGQFGLCLVPPEEAVERALSNVARLAEEDGMERLFGFLDPPRISADWYGPSLTLTVAAHGRDFWSSGLDLSRAISWRWQEIALEPDWYDEGWLPDIAWYGLRRPWRARLWRGLNRQDVWALQP